MDMDEHGVVPTYMITYCGVFYALELLVLVLFASVHNSGIARHIIIIHFSIYFFSVLSFRRISGYPR